MIKLSKLQPEQAKHFCLALTLFLSQLAQPKNDLTTTILQSYAMFTKANMVENSRIAVGISMLSIIVPEISVFPFWAAILLFPVVAR